MDNSNSLFDYIIALSDELTPPDRARVLDRLEPYRVEQVFLCKTEQKILLSRFLEELAAEAENEAIPIDDWRSFLNSL